MCTIVHRSYQKSRSQRRNAKEEIVRRCCCCGCWCCCCCMFLSSLVTECIHALIPVHQNTSSVRYLFLLSISVSNFSCIYKDRGKRKYLALLSICVALENILLMIMIQMMSENRNTKWFENTSCVRNMHTFGIGISFE